MAFAIDTYTGNGSTTTYSVTFPYIEKAHVVVTLDGVTKNLTSDYTFASSSTITFSTAPASGVVIKFTRSSNRTARLVDYQDGSTLTEATLDQDGNQSFFMAQEAIDVTENTIGLTGSDEWDADNKKIINVTDPTTNQGAATKNYVDTKLAADVSTVNTYKTAAETAKTAAETAKTSAETANTSAQSALTQVQTIYDTFDDRFLGAKSSNPSVDNDGNTLQDGALYWDTGNNLLKVYDLSNTQWVQVQLSSTNQTNVNTVAGQISPTNNIATVAGANSNITTIASDINGSNNLGTVATNIANVNLTGGSIANVNTVATNLSGVNSFAERYRVQAGVPSSNNDVGDLVFDQTAGKLKVFDGSSYALAGSSVNGTSQRFKFTATAGQTTFTTDDAGTSLTYDVASGTAFADIYLNGVKLDTTDFTATNGTSIVLASGASVNDILQVVAYGTFNLASFSASNLTSGTINGDRLPSPVLTVKGDGSSTDGAIQLNCSQNSHGVKIKSPPHSAGQSYTLTLPQSITNGYYLKTDGSGNLSFAEVPQPVVPTVADVSQTIAPATATTINITGANFVSIPIVEFIKTDGSVTLANTVSFTNATTLSVNVTLASGNYYVRVENPDGNAGRSTNNILTASTAPSFTINAGSLGTFAGNSSGTLATITGSSDSAITFSEVGSNLATANVTLNSSTGALETTDFGGSSTTATLTNFTIRITDAENQTTDRAFSFTSSFGLSNGGQFN
tara:strand:+ start:702 stop:2909 length:2208 start_codon:yes stop_codon:yes gene_type:complete